jgi:hypothetical protein
VSVGAGDVALDDGDQSVEPCISLFALFSQRHYLIALLFYDIRQAENGISEVAYMFGGSLLALFKLGHTFLQFRNAFFEFNNIGCKLRLLFDDELDLSLYAVFAHYGLAFPSASTRVILAPNSYNTLPDFRQLTLKQTSPLFDNTVDRCKVSLAQLPNP